MKAEFLPLSHRRRSVHRFHIFFCSKKSFLNKFTLDFHVWENAFSQYLLQRQRRRNTRLRCTNTIIQSPIESQQTREVLLYLVKWGSERSAKQNRGEGTRFVLIWLSWQSSLQRLNVRHCFVINLFYFFLFCAPVQSFHFEAVSSWAPDINHLSNAAFTNARRRAQWRTDWWQQTHVQTSPLLWDFFSTLSLFSYTYRKLILML